ncbi:TCR/Tet family MFS transporter [Turneriella parva]|uniref:Major facilitator superfamily MFS_1 n=1 Tax=Turneriella parva (strain ATCC BAA-1111 / DSM 21527 / NCTC 11395 / H) TaxID=869212 RepID=I4B1S1_TURPD|nr:tetracycline resistance MFS efflux pump [Turneriella parva]AFM11228.1 major facilitator superfamily MFS_1 [Turneriella parva DSM 21527]
MAGTRASSSFIFITILLDVIGFGLIIPVMPKMVSKFTSSDVETNYWYMVMTASYGVMQFFFSPILGALSDKFGRRPVILISIVGLGLDFILQGIAWSIPVLFAARVLGGITGASFSVGSAYIADVTSAEDRAKGFGMIGMAFGIGFILGPMLGGFLGDYRAELPFFAAAAFSLLNALYGLFVLPESLPKHLRTAFSLKKANAFSALKGLVELKGLGMFILAIALTNLAQFMMHSVWVRYTETRFLWSPKDNGVALFAVGMSAAIVQGGLLGVLIKTLGEVRLAKVGLFFAAMQFILMGLAPQGFYMYIIMLVTILASAAGPALQAHVSRAVPPHKQGIAMGSLTSIGSITQVIAPFAGLSILSKFTHAPGALNTLQAGMPFFASAALQFVAFALAVWYFNRGQISSGSGGTKSIITG